MLKQILSGALLAILVYSLAVAGTVLREEPKHDIQPYHTYQELEFEKTEYRSYLIEQIINEPTSMDIDVKINRSKKETITFNVTAYCSCSKCCGVKSDPKYIGLTASGNYAKEGITIAADTDILPMGTRVYIEGIGERVVQDTGSAINGYDIDLYFNSHEEAKIFGVKQLEVEIIS